jgi:hypothetical protein
LQRRELLALQTRLAVSGEVQGRPAYLDVQSKENQEQPKNADDPRRIRHPLRGLERRQRCSKKRPCRTTGGANADDQESGGGASIASGAVLQPIPSRSAHEPPCYPPSEVIRLRDSMKRRLSRQSPPWRAPSQLRRQTSRCASRASSSCGLCDLCGHCYDDDASVPRACKTSERRDAKPRPTRPEPSPLACSAAYRWNSPSWLRR